MAHHPIPSASLHDLMTCNLVEKFLEFKRTQGCSVKTLELYGGKLRQIASDFPSLPLDPTVIQGWIHEHGGQAPLSKHGTFRTLRTFYHWLVRFGLLSGSLDPFHLVVAPIVRKTIPRTFSRIELRRIVEASKPGVERAVIVTLMDTGARIGELAPCTKDDLVDGCLRVAGKTGQRILILSPAVFGFLKDSETYHLFPWTRRGRIYDHSYSSDGLANVVSRVIKRAGLTGPKLGPHAIRHSFATHYINRGGDVASLQQLLGHSNINTTARYISLAMDSLKAKHGEYAVFSTLASLDPLPSREAVEAVDLPQEAAQFPVHIDGCLALLFLVVDRRTNHTWYYIRAREAGKSGWDGAKKWRVCSLGSDLPLEYVDGLRRAIMRENQRREALIRDADKV